MEYLKLSNVQARIDDGDFTQAALLAGIVDAGGLTSGDYVVVNLKGRILKRSEVDAHLTGALDGETVSA